MNVEWKMAVLPHRISSVYSVYSGLYGDIFRMLSFYMGNFSGASEAVLSCFCCTSPLSPLGGA